MVAGFATGLEGRGDRDRARFRGREPGEGRRLRVAGRPARLFRLMALWTIARTLLPWADDLESGFDETATSGRFVCESAGMRSMPPRTLETSMGLWKRSSGRLAIIRATIRLRASGISGLRVAGGTGDRDWWARSLSASVPRAKEERR